MGDVQIHLHYGNDFAIGISDGRCFNQPKMRHTVFAQSGFLTLMRPAVLEGAQHRTLQAGLVAMLVGGVAGDAVVRAEGLLEVPIGGRDLQARVLDRDVAGHLVEELLEVG